MHKYVYILNCTFFSQKPNRNRLKPHRTEPNGLVSFRFWLQNRTAPQNVSVSIVVSLETAPNRTAPTPCCHKMDIESFTK